MNKYFDVLTILLIVALIFASLAHGRWLPYRLNIILAVMGVIAFFGQCRKVWDLLPKCLGFVWLLWLAAGVLSLVWAIDPEYSWKEFKNDGLLPAGLFFSLLILLNKGWQVKAVWGAFLAASLVLAASGYAEFIGGILDRPDHAFLWPGVENRVRGLAPHVHTYLMIIFMSFPFWIYAIYLAGSARQRLFWGAGLVVVFVGWLLGHGRVEMAFLPVFLVLTFLMVCLKRRWFNTLIAVMFISSFVFVGWLSQLPYQMKSSNIHQRQFMWNLAANYIERHPFTGIGFGALSYMQLDETGLSDFPDSPAKSMSPSGGGNHPHNFFVNIWLTTGLQGFLALITLAIILYLTVSQAIDPKPGVDQQLLFGLRAFCLAMIACGMINMADSLLVRNVIKLFCVLAAAGVKSVYILKSDR